MELAAFIALAILAVLRLPAIRRGGASTLSELALLAGTGALFMVGSVVPLPVLDGWFGGTNVVNLLQNVLATLAIWFMTTTAAIMSNDARIERRSVRGLILVLLAFSVPFFLIDRGSTHLRFIWAYADDPWLWLYASIYMGYVAYLMFRMLRALKGRTARAYRAVRVGAVLMATASVLEIAYLSGRVLGVHLEAVGDAFIPVFYGGILLIAVGLSWFPLARAAREIALRIAAELLRNTGGDTARLRRAEEAGDTASHSTYRLAVQLADFGNTTELTRSQRIALWFASHLLNLQVPAPQVIRMTAIPKTGA